MSKPQSGNAIKENTASQIIEVYLSGEVMESHVVLEDEFTLKDLLDKITLSEKANIEGMDLSMILTDEMNIHIPSIEAKISLNKATKEELMSIKGIGEKTAQRIMEYRQKQPYKTIEDIMNIKGIGEKKYLKYRDYLCLSSFFHYLFPV